MNLAPPKPTMCGPRVDVRAVLRYRAYHLQLWRFTDYEIDKKPFIPIELNKSVVAHRTPVSAKDKVMAYGVFGTVLYINREFGEACVRHFDEKPYRDTTYDLDLFEAQSGKVRWRIE